MTADDVLYFWFQHCLPWQWFRRRDSFDGLVRNRFAALVERALVGELDAWADSPAHGLALVLLLDQFSRQIWRDEAKAFAGDQQAQALSEEALQRGWIQSEPERAKRQFWLMPLLHSEGTRWWLRPSPCSSTGWIPPRLMSPDAIPSSCSALVVIPIAMLLLGA